MQVEWLLILLPLAALSGWWLGRRTEPRDEPTVGSKLTSEYFRGLNFLLNEQPDKAIEVFIRALEVDSETVELHLALASLFRRKGQVDRATRIHQNLIARPNLTQSQHNLAIFELAQDYLSAGLFDRAENLFRELEDVEPHRKPAIHALVHVYEKEKEWRKAIAAARKLGQVAGADARPVVAHYYCELAQEALEEQRFDEACELLNSARKENPQNVRTALLTGECHFHEQRYREAIDAWRRIERDRPELLQVVLPRIVDAYRELGNSDAELSDYLTSLLEQHGGEAVVDAWVNALESQHGVATASTRLAEYLRERPGRHGVRWLLDHWSNDPGSTDLDILLPLVKVLTDDSGDDAKRFLCQQCGFAGRSLHWQCPGCDEWDTCAPAVAGIS